MQLIYENILFPWLIFGVIAFILLLKVKAPYGKFSSKKWGATMPYKLGWFIQEIISPIFFSYFFLTGSLDIKSVSWIFFIFWNIHYFNRSIILPLQQKKKSPPMPIIVVLLAIIFNIINGFINGYYLGSIQTYDMSYLLNINFVSGLVIFLVGFFINFKSDRILLNLKNNNKGYQIPRGFMYNYISSPNYFGEIIEWTGFAIMTWSIPGFLFALWTAFNLVPRSLSNHKWYIKQFSDYPKSRKAIIPFIL